MIFNTSAGAAWFRQSLFTLLALIVVLPAQAQTAHSLDRVPRLLKTPESKAIWAQQMEGKPGPDGLGTHLPPQLTAEQITTLLVPERERRRIIFTGAKLWPLRANSYVAIVCLNDAGILQDEEGRCEGDGVYIGVIEVLRGAKPRLVAASGLFTGTIRWDRTDLPSFPMAVEVGQPIEAESWDRFDLAPYQIRPGEYAFGLRGRWFEGYAGGGGFFGALYLFRIDGDRLRLIFAEPMSVFQTVAGDWNPDGTREHDVTDVAKTLVIARSQTNGFFDLILKKSGSRSQRLFRWSAAEGRYRAQ